MQGVSFTATTIYLTPTTLSAITFNFLMSLSGGMIAGYVVSKGDAFWTYSAGLAGIITASAGNDLYHPIQAMLIGMLGATVAYKAHYFVERRFKIDDAVGAVAVHGYCGMMGLVVAGFMLWGHPATPFADAQRQPARPDRGCRDHVRRAGLPAGLHPRGHPQGGRACCASPTRSSSSAWTSPNTRAAISTRRMSAPPSSATPGRAAILPPAPAE